jgi:exo-beta-1,3-glucanase (GH17 family)
MHCSHSSQFGFTGGDQWETRRDSLITSLTTNSKAKFVTRGVQFGSEPLYDNVLTHSELASQVTALKSNLTGVQIPVTVSELAYGYQERGGAQDVLDAIDFINIHMLPFFSALATTGAAAWPLVQTDMDWFIQNGGGKKMYFDEVRSSSYKMWDLIPTALSVERVAFCHIVKRATEQPCSTG